MHALLRSTLGFLATVVGIAAGYVLWHLYGLIGLGALIVGLMVVGFFTRKPGPKAPKAPEGPNPWLNN